MGKNPSRKLNMTSKVTKLLGAKQDNKTKETAKSVFGFDPDMIFHTIKTSDIQKYVMYRRQEGNSDATILYELGALNQTITIVGNFGYSPK